MRVIGDRVLVVLPPEPDEIKSEAGLVLIRDPDILRTAVHGLVVQVGEKRGVVDVEDAVASVEASGPGRFDWSATKERLIAEFRALKPAPFDVQVGDMVVFPRFAGDEVHVGDLKYCVLRESEIIGIVNPKESAA